VPKTGFGSRAECFQSLAVVLRPSQSCSITSFWHECKSSNGSPRREVRMESREKAWCPQTPTSSSPITWSINLRIPPLDFRWAAFAVSRPAVSMGVPVRATACSWIRNRFASLSLINSRKASSASTGEFVFSLSSQVRSAPRTIKSIAR